MRELARVVAFLALFEVVGGVLVALATFLLNLWSVAVPGWSFGDRHEVVAHFTGVPGFLAAGLAMLALRFVGRPRWILGGVLAGIFAFGNALLTVFVTVAGMHPQVAWMLGSVEALVLGLWVADLFGHLREPRILGALAVNAYIALVTLLLLNEWLPLAYPVMVPLLLTVPLLVGGIYEAVESGVDKRLPAALAGGALLLMGVLAGSLWMLMPFISG